MPGGGSGAKQANCRLFMKRPPLQRTDVFCSLDVASHEVGVSHINDNHLLTQRPASLGVVVGEQAAGWRRRLWAGAQPGWCPVPASKKPGLPMRTSTGASEPPTASQGTKETAAPCLAGGETRCRAAGSPTQQSFYSRSGYHRHRAARGHRPASQQPASLQLPTGPARVSGGSLKGTR